MSNTVGPDGDDPSTTSASIVLPPAVKPMLQRSAAASGQADSRQSAMHGT
jgi:hypothetical protein